jgi:asparagine synthase (glutamine-hydrolysing)
MLQIQNEPGHSAGNAYWILEMEQAAKAHGCHVLLTGQTGNAGISWTGNVFSQPLGFQLRHLGLRGWGKAQAQRAKDQLKRALFGQVKGIRYRRLERQQWHQSTAIHRSTTANYKKAAACGRD